MRWLAILAALLAVVLSADARVGAAAPSLTVQAPTNGAVIRGDSVTVAFQVADTRLVASSVPLNEAGKRPEANRPGEGHLHLMLDLSPVVVWERAEPYTYTNVPAGAHRLMVEVVNNDHSPLSPPVTQVIQFQVAPAMPTAGLGGGSPQPFEGGLGLLALLLLFAPLAARAARRWR
jgi:hypothetical protein